MACVGQGTLQDLSNMPIQFQTMRFALGSVYDQLVAYATYLGITPSPVDKTLLIDGLMSSLQTFDPKERLDSMVALTESYGKLALPGHGTTASLTMDQLLARAGAPVH